MRCVSVLVCVCMCVNFANDVECVRLLTFILGGNTNT